MGNESKHTIEQTALTIFARGGYDALSMRVLAKESGVSLSSIYHFFADKDVLLKAIFDRVNTDLGKARSILPGRRTAYASLLDRVQFQFTHIEEIVFVLKYYLHYRPQFLRVDTGYVPPKAYLHIDEVIQKAIQTGEYQGDDPVADAKVMTHAINGFLLEYYPSPPRGRELAKLSEEIADFLYRSITNERRNHVLVASKKS
jgi:AcrR family transcriptional regulator